jgi:hypothetical protein
MLVYADCGELPEFKGNERYVWPIAKQAIDRARAESEKLAANGSKGGRPRKNQEKPNETKENQEKPNESHKVKESKVKESKVKENKEIDARFDRFWSVYPRHVAKPNARKAFDKLNPDDVLLETMIRAIEQQKRSDQWTRDNGQYIPHPATWINQRRWEDETPIASQKPSKTVNAQDYDQRDYNEVQDNLIRQQNKRFAERLGRVG